MEEKKFFLETKIIAKNKIYFKEIDSTQIQAKQLAEKNIENGTIVITDYQTGGIGTHGRSWYSEREKNLAFSLIIYPKCTIQKLDTLSIDIARCITRAIEKLYGYKLSIKTPNDIIYNKKKMGGILTQIVTNGKKIKYLIVGIGFNVNGENFPEELKEIATSMKLEFRKEFSRVEILNEFCNLFEEYCILNKII